MCDWNKTCRHTRKHKQRYLCHKLWQTASGDLRLFWLWQSHTAPEARPEPPCLLLRLLLWHLHHHHHQLQLLLVPSSRCCPCQHPHRHPSLHGRCRRTVIANPCHDITEMENNNQGLSHCQAGTCSANEQWGVGGWGWTNAVPVFTTLKPTASAGVVNFNKCATESHHIYNRITALFSLLFSCWCGTRAKLPTVYMMNTATVLIG